MQPVVRPAVQRVVQPLEQKLLNNFIIYNFYFYLFIIIIIIILLLLLLLAH